MKYEAGKKKKFAGPVLLAIIVVAGVAESALWKNDATRFQQSLDQGVLTTEQTASTQAKRADPTLAPPSISWVTSPQGAAQNRIAMAFKVGASAPLRSVKISITPVVKMPGIEVGKEVMDVPTYFIGRKSLDWDGQIDLTRSLLAGGPVVLQIIAQDNDKREGLSDTVSITLPEHNFNHPVAKAIYGLRKTLKDEPHAKRLETLRSLAMILQQRDNFENQELTLLTLRSAAVRIALDRSTDGLRSALDLLWHAAILFEDAHPVGLAKS